MAGQGNENQMRQTAVASTQMMRLGRVIADNRHKFYDPISREMLPPFATFVHTIQLAVEDLVGSTATASATRLLPPIEEAIISYFVDEQTNKLIHSFSGENLDKEREYALSHDHYVSNTQQRIIKLKGALLLAENGQCARAYACVSLLYELCAFALRPMLLQFTNSVQQKRNDGVYQSISGIIILKELTRFAQLLHRFAAVKWAPESIDILTPRIRHGVLDEYKLRTVASRIKQIVDDNILIYIVQHINTNPTEDILITTFDDDIFEKYFIHLQTIIDFTDGKHAELSRKETIRKISINLFDHLPDAELNYYTRNHKARLEKQDLYYFTHAELIEDISLFIDHVFQTMLIDELQIPLLLKAVWNDVKAQQNLAQFFTDMKDLRVRISIIDQEIISLVGREKLFYDILNNFNFVEGSQTTDIFDKFTIIDSRFAETIHIFRGIAKQIVAQFRKLSKDRTTARKRMIRNWIEVERVCVGIEYKLLKAISVFEDCIELVEAVYKHSKSGKGVTSTQD